MSERPEDPLNEELWSLIKRIPRGRCASYGAVGRALSTPLSGFLVGRRLRRTPDGADIPWWRVIAQSGQLPVVKLDPYLGMEQAERLRQEGVPFKEERVVDLERCQFDF
jgi:methylated-DNA-protein-cysteine methyltransferase-like protein